MLSLFRWAIFGVVGTLWVAPAWAQTAGGKTPEANPGRPTVSTPATLTPVGYLQFENGVLYASGSAEFSTQLGLNQVTRYTVAPRLQLLALSGPFAHSEGTVDDSGLRDQPGGVSVGVQAVALPGQGHTPTLSVSYLRDVYDGAAPDIDIGSAQQSALVLVSGDYGGFHVDANAIFNEQTDGAVRRGQFGQTLSVSRPLGSSGRAKRFTAAGEVWHFSQPLTGGNAVGNLWAISYEVRKNLVFDAGFNRGLTSSSTQWEGFAGFTYLLPHRLWSFGGGR